MVFTGVMAALAAVSFGFFLWQGLWPKVQCWLLVIVGAGAAGLIGQGIDMALSKATDATNTATSVMFGVVTPSLLALWVILGFIIEMLPDSKVRSRPVSWHTRICAVLLPTAIVSIPAIFNTITASVGA